MEFTLLGWPDDGPTLRLDHEQFSYAGKFVMSTTGKAVVRTDDVTKSDAGDGPFADNVLAAVAFDADRTDPDTLRCRYITVRTDRRGEGIGPRLLRFLTERARANGYDRVSIAVNNPFAYEAAYRAGFAFTGETTGLAELVCASPPTEGGRERYQRGLDRYRERDLTDAEEQFLAARVEPPETVDPPV
ncbi:GNAT family N-acetyltransferase [Salinibaculum rarum]|uniref:GNAT family N-acetyltransferase n=1 Tax=Salinibaculum rarum TaxID=3058903 RepID=UPI00265FBBD2|nr:GNAT family N-acetyltransferase [Salinibaculum sp. KK48]